ncbi:MAG: sulfatase-like hydrolase/transferase [Bryobacterales bacterium]|jgi:arylsulfatase A-like enzyme|nr:sulfatase-like hydrolase/transferase [Bryobacterales bacterium]
MRRRDFFGVAALAAAACRSRPATKPNFLFILADQWRADALGVAGNTFVKTPNVDKLASEGVRFANAYSPMALCTPTRASLLTGVYPITHNLRGNVYKIDTVFGDPQYKLEPHYPGLLKSHGWKTAYIGKWHLGEKDPGFFDYYNGYNSQWPHWLGERDNSPYRPDVETEDAMRWMEENQEGPFFLEVSYYPPHDPYNPPQRYVDMYEGQSIPHVEYYAACTAIDWNIGRLLEKVDKLGLRDNTVVIFVSEHGETFAERPLSTNKRVGYEESAKVPWIMRFPHVIPHDEVYEGGVVTIDLMPTLLDLAGIPIPARVEGHTRLPELLKGDLGWKQPVIQMNVTQPRVMGGPYDERMVRFEEWKLILRKFTPDAPPETKAHAAELYNLTADPGETQNVFESPANRAKVTELAGYLRKWGEKIGDPLSVELTSPLTG